MDSTSLVSLSAVQRLVERHGPFSAVCATVYVVFVISAGHLLHYGSFGGGGGREGGRRGLGCGSFINVKRSVFLLEFMSVSVIMTVAITSVDAQARSELRVSSIARLKATVFVSF